MGKAIPTAANRIQDIARRVPKRVTNFSEVQKRISVKMEATGGSSSSSTTTTTRKSSTALGEVVTECVRRWFQDTLKEAKGGDTSMQVLVAQMYFSGYGIPKDPHKGRLWINRASKSRSSVWKVGEKHPGYNASDSDSDEIKEDAK